MSNSDHLPPGGSIYQIPLVHKTSVTNPINTWTNNSSVKTCKCENCGDRVTVYSLKCNKCLRHICSECLDPQSNKTDRHKAFAKNKFEEGCWHRFHGNMHPRFAKWTAHPPIRTEEERKAKLAKQKGMANRNNAGQATSTSSTADANPSDVDEYVEEDEDDLSETLLSRSSSNGVKRKRYIEDESDQETVESNATKSIFKTLGKYVKKPKAKKQNHLSKVDNQLDLRHNQSYEGKGKQQMVEDQRALSDVDEEISPLQGGHTIIAGAGVIGLFVARELALRTHEADMKHNITVIEVRKKHCELASGNCNGFLTTEDMPETWSTLANTSKSCWNDIVASTEICEQLGFSANTLLGVNQDIGDSGASSSRPMPSWAKGLSQCSIIEDAKALGRINPAKLANWLYEQCEALGVEFLFSHVAYRAKLNQYSMLSEVYVENMGNKGDEPFRLKCDNLVLAAGPYTPWYFGDIFEDSVIKLKNNVQSAHWFQTIVDDLTPDDEVALYLPHAAKGSDKFEDEVVMVPDPVTRTVAVSSFASKMSPVKPNVADALAYNRGKTAELRALAAQFLTQPQLDNKWFAKKLLRGCSNVSTANNGNPIIDKVLASGLGQVCEEDEDSSPCGVWLCYGFGRHGTTLAPGAAQMLVAKMLNTPVDDDDFGLPFYSISTANVEDEKA